MLQENSLKLGRLKAAKVGVSRKRYIKASAVWGMIQERGCVEVESRGSKTLSPAAVALGVLRAPNAAVASGHGWA